MAPIRRYLRITKYSVLECRIYLDNPALAHSWLLNPRDPVLPKVIESVRPLVLPKLREEKERERSRKKSKKRSIKDVVLEDDFEVSIFLTETDTRHSLLHKHKLFRDKVQTRLTSNSAKLMGASREEPIDVEGCQFPPGAAADAAAAGTPILLREEDDDQDAINLADIPMVDETRAPPPLDSTNRRPKRRRRSPAEPRAQGQEAHSSSDGGGSTTGVAETDSSDDELFAGEGEESDESDAAAIGRPRAKRRREQQKRGGRGEGEEEGVAAAAGGDTAAAGRDNDDDDDNNNNDNKKKMAMDISYEGFAIYGRVLCLVVKRRGDGAASRVGSTAAPSSAAQTGRPGGQAMMENWIASTQMPDEEAAAAETEAL